MEGKRIDSKLMLFTVVLVLITLLLLNYLFKNNSKEKIWDYNNITTAEDIIYIGNKVEDRKIYYNIEQIVKDYITSYEVVDKNEKTYVDYYKYLSEDYKKVLNKKEYKKVAEHFFDKLKTTYSSGYKKIEKNNILKELFKLDNNLYLGKVQSDYSENYGYIAILFNEKSFQYEIVWIE